VYQITSAGAVSRYSTGGVNTVLAPIAPAAGSTWTDTATDPTTGVVYGAAIVGSCVSSTLSTLNLTAGTSTPIGTITGGGGCIAAIAIDNLGRLWGINVAGDTLVSINKTTGTGTVVGPIGFNTNFGQAMDCDPASGTCYMFTINVTSGNTAELRSVNTATGATALVGLIGSTAPAGGVQVAGAVFETIADTCMVDANCQDGDLCNGVETCVANSCAPGTPVNCDDGLFCTTDTCTPATGACSHPPKVCSDGDSCTIDACDEAANACTHSTPPPIHRCNTGAITIPPGGTATPYPSTITVAGLGTTASLCSVQLLGLGHTFPLDIDMLLVGPGTPQNAIIMSDAGGSNAVSGINLTLKDSAAQAIPSPLVSGTFQPLNVVPGDTFAAPAPAPTGGSALSAFDGTNPNGDWKLFVVDDTDEDQGSITGGWCVDIVVTGCSTNAECSDGNFCNGTEMCVAGACASGTPINCNDGQFCTIDSCDPPTGNCGHAPNACSDGAACTADSCDEANDVCLNANICLHACNSGSIAINDSGAPPTKAAPYPSVVSVSGAIGIFSLVSVDFKGLTHTFPNDIDILLTAPNSPTNAIIMSDVGGGGPGPVGVDLSLTDGAPPVPAPLVSGSFAPSNVNPGTGTETWPAPAPLPTGASPLSQFNGTNPNGNWSLYVVDDQSMDSGTISGGWCLNYRLTCNTAADCDDGDPCTADTCVSSACVQSPLAKPGLVSGVVSDPDKRTLTWIAGANATRYDAVRGSLAALPVGPGGGDEVCFGNLATTAVVDAAVPAVASGFWYLVRGENDCSAGGYGTEKNGTPRVTTTCP
jgi:subtilisin-like proprotein convertase family protein